MLFATLFVAALVAPSQPPTPRPTVGSQAPQQQTQPQGADPKQHVTPVPSANGQEGTKDPKQPTDPKQGESPTYWWSPIDPNWVIAFLTFVLAWLGYRQWKVMDIQAAISKTQNKIIQEQSAIMEAQQTAAAEQSEYMRDGLIETRRAADAATAGVEIAKEALIVTERAYIDVKGLTIEPLKVGEQATASFEVRNSGRTPARNVTIKGYYHIGLAPPDRPDVPMSVHGQNQFIGAGSSIVCPAGVMVIETEADLALVT